MNVCAETKNFRAGEQFRVVGGATQRLKAGEPSRLGAGLLDVTVDSDPREPLPTRILGILDHWYTGRPAEKNMWAG